MPDTSQQAQNGLSLELAAALASRVQITSVRLLNSRCEMIPQRVMAGEQAVHFVYKTQARIDREANTIGVACRIDLKATSETEKHEEPSLTIETTYLLEYKAEDVHDIDEKQLRSFGHFNGIYNAWPYFREYIQSTVARMGLPPLTLPVYRFGGELKSTPD